MQVSKEGIEALKAANPLAAVVSERGISLKKKGRVLVAPCPFHEDKTPSFTVTPSKGLFHCFGCGVAGDVIGFLTRYEKTSFPSALELLAKRAGLELEKLMAPHARRPSTPIQALTPPRGTTAEGAPLKGAPPQPAAAPPEILGRVVEHYHRTFCERDDAQAYLAKRGLTDTDLLKALKVGYADGSLLKTAPKGSALRRQLLSLGVVTTQGRELMGGCVVVPIPDPLSGQWASLYGRGMKTPRHCYLPGPLRGVINFQAARSSEQVILTESILDALSFLQAGISTAIPIYGTNGFTSEHLDLLKREGVKRVILALDNDEPGKKATDALKEKLTSAGISVRVASFPSGIKDANQLLVSRNGDAGAVFQQLLDTAEPRATPSSSQAAAVSPLSEKQGVTREDGQLVLTREELTYRAKTYAPALGRMRATVKLSSNGSLHIDTIDLYSSRSRAEFARRAAKAFEAEAGSIEKDLMALLVAAEKSQEETKQEPESKVPEMSEAERDQALAFLESPDLLDQAARDVDALGYVGEETNKRLLYLVAISRKQEDPLSAIVLSQSGAGKSGLTEAIERLTPPEDVVLFTRLTPQSLYYTEPGYLDHKLIIVEERYGSQDADYSIRVLQSRKKLSVAAPIKDPTTGNMRTKVFSVEARAAFIEATTASSVNHENATRCFELTMDETAEQTKRIHERQRLMKTKKGLKLRKQAEATCRRHWNAQRLLEPLPVIIPFADKLTFPTAWMRTRRDHARFLNLIEVSAFLHQHQRGREDGAIVADAADYAVAYDLAGQVLADTLSDLKKPLREAFERIRGLSSEADGSVSRREIREALNVPDSTVRGWLHQLVELEYLSLADQGGKGAGRSARYCVVERSPGRQLVLGLLTPEELADKNRETRKTAKATSRFPSR